MYRCFILLLAVILVSGCHVSNMSQIDFGLLEKFVKEHDIPYEAPEEKQELCKNIVDLLISNNTSSITDEMYEYLNSPDIVNFRFQKKDFIGMQLDYVLEFPQETYYEATYLSIQYEKEKNWMIALYMEDSQISKHIEITDQSFKEKIYAVEKKYQEYIEEGRKIM